MTTDQRLLNLEGLYSTISNVINDIVVILNNNNIQLNTHFSESTSNVFSRSNAGRNRAYKEIREKLTDVLEEQNNKIDTLTNNQGQSVINQLGILYNFPNGDSAYYTIPPTSIPWTYTTSILPSTSNILLWIDSKESKSIKTSNDKKIVSKDGNNIEVISGNNFTYNNTDYFIDLSTEGVASTNTSLTPSTFTLFIVFKFKSTIPDNGIIFQHGNISILLSIRTNRPKNDNASANRICLSFNNTILREITINNFTDLYQLVVRSDYTFNLSSFESQITDTGSLTQTTDKIYIGNYNDVSGTYSGIKLYELVYYSSLISVSSLLTYGNTRWSALNNYIPSDKHIINPYTISSVSAVFISSDLSVGAITSWSDVIGNKTLTLGTGTNDPVVDNTNYSSIKCVVFTTTTKKMELTNTFLNSSINSSFTYFVLLNTTGSGSGTSTETIRISDGTNNWTSYFAVGSSALECNNYTLNSYSASNQMVNNTWLILTYQYNNNGTVSLRKNGASISTTTSGTASGTFGTQKLILNNSNAQNYGMAGFVISNALLSSTQIQEIEGYLVWGQLGAGTILDNGHTYKNSAPLSFTP